MDRGRAEQSSDRESGRVRDCVRAAAAPRSSGTEAVTGLAGVRLYARAERGGSRQGLGAPHYFVARIVVVGFGRPL
jgi:hypothetical protein